MTVVVPEPTPLDMPPGDVGALDGLVVDVACAAHDLAVLGERLAGPAANAPGWVGDDAIAAAAQVTRLAALMRECSTEVLSATGRLTAHADVWHEARRTIARLQAEQDDDFAATWRRLSRETDLPAMFMTNDPALVAIVGELEAAEAARRSRHAAVLAEVADDAAATARALGEYSTVVGGSGAPGEAGRVVAYLSAALPGWGDLELADRGRALAAEMLGRSMSPVERSRLAQEAAVFADRQPFAEALLVGLGLSGVRGLLLFLGSYEEPENGPVAQLLAAAFSVVAPSGEPGNPLDEVLSAGYVRSDNGFAPSDLIALGMGAVLGAAAATGRALRPAVLVSWGRQLVARDRAQGVPLLAVVAPRADGTRPTDPLQLIVAALADAGHAPATELLTTPGAWDVLLGRMWTDGGEALDRILDQAVSMPGERGAAAIRSGLVALGSGLADGDPIDWTVNIPTASALTPRLAQVLAARIEVVVDALGVGVDGQLTDEQAAVLRGLGYLTLDRAAAAQVQAALLDWARIHPGTVDGMVRAAPSPAVAVPSAYLAVEQYGQRLAYAMHGYIAKHVAEGKKSIWDGTLGLAIALTFGKVGTVLSGVEPAITRFLGVDGSWSNGRDHGLVFTSAQAAELAVASPLASEPSPAVARQVSGAFDRTLSAMHVPAPPVQPPDLKGLLDLGNVLMDLRQKLNEVHEDLPEVLRRLPK